MVAALTGLTMQRLLAEVRAGRDRLAGVLNAATETAIVAVHPSGATITLFNRGAERMLGYSAQEVVGVASPGLFLDRAEIGHAPRSSASNRATRSSSPSRGARARRPGNGRSCARTATGCGSR